MKERLRRGIRTSGGRGHGALRREDTCVVGVFKSGRAHSCPPLLLFGPWQGFPVLYSSHSTSLWYDQCRLYSVEVYCSATLWRSGRHFRTRSLPVRPPLMSCFVRYNIRKGSGKKRCRLCISFNCRVHEGTPFFSCSTYCSIGG